MATAPSIGRTLARLAALSPRHPKEGEPASDSRAQIRHLIETAEEPVSVEWLCSRTDLHPNTVRGHLEVLLAAGQIARAPGRREGRGRPPMLYRAVGPESPIYQELVTALVAELGDSTEPALIDDAADRWAEVVDHSGSAQSIDEALEQAAKALNQLGFSAHVSSVGDTITLGSCPYAALIREQPVICDIHTALLRELLARTGQPVAVKDMQVWAAPGICRTHLHRPDRQPVRVIDVAEPGERATQDGPGPVPSSKSEARTRRKSAGDKNGNVKKSARNGKNPSGKNPSGKNPNGKNPKR